MLNTEPGAITPATCLVADLGAESIDFLDISCELEKLVGVELNFKEVFKARREHDPEAGLDLAVSEIVASLRMLAPALPAA